MPSRNQTCNGIWFLTQMIGTSYLAFTLGQHYRWYFLARIFCFFSVKDKNITLKKEYYSYALSFSIPLIVHSLSIYVLGQSDRLMIKYFCGDSSVGIYSLIYQYALLITMVTTSINSAWNPWFHDNYALGNFGMIKEKVKPLMMIGCYLGIGCVAIAPEAILILGGEKYLVGIDVILPIALGVIIEFVYTQYVIIEMHPKKTKYIFVSIAIAAVINISLNYICIPKLGYQAAAYTTLFSYIILWAIHAITTRKVMKIHLYNDIFNCILVVITSILCIIFASLYNCVVIRYFLLIIVSVVYLAFNKEIIISKISNLRKKKT